MLEQLRTLYATWNWARYVMCIGTLALSILLFWVSGGFPPHAWRFLIQTVPLIPHLWMLKGPSMLLPLIALLVLSLTLLFFWVFLVTAVMWIGKQQWLYYREQQEQDFDPSSQEAQDSIQDLYTSTNSNNVQPQHWREEHSAQPSNEGVNVAHTSLPHAVSSSPLVLTSSTEPQSATLSRAPTQPLKLPKPVQTNPPRTLPARTNPAAHRLTFAVGTGLDAGIKRKNQPNEDSLLVIQGTHTYNTQIHPFGLFIIADGMGGHANGQEASRMAIQHIRDVVIPTLLSSAEIDGEHARELLLDGVQHANLAVYQQNQQHQSDMGTTVTTALIIDKTIAIANVGDSRTYLYSEQDGLRQVTKDHSLVGQLFEQGGISEDDIYIHPRRNEIFRCIGEKASVSADTFMLPLKRGITLLCCSDGLWEMVRNRDIEQILRATLPDATQASKALIQAALDGGGKDNVSVIVVHIPSQSNGLRQVHHEQRLVSRPMALNG